jgi:hypothetical protein
MKRAAIVTLVLLASSSARAEEGLTVLRLAGGISMVHPDMPKVGGAISTAVDYGFSERLGGLASALIVLHDKAKTLGLGVGFRGLLVERPWWRLFAHVGPELMLVWRPEQDVRADLSFRGGIGFEYLLMWGLGFVFEIYGSAPMGLGSPKFLDGANTGATLGLFMEF